MKEREKIFDEMIYNPSACSTSSSGGSGGSSNVSFRETGLVLHDYDGHNSVILSAMRNITNDELG